MSTPKKIFLTGATGYIGGSVLSHLLKSPQKYVVSALVRRKEQGEALQKLGVTPVYGSLEDAEILFNAAKAADAVIHTANSADDLPSTQALVNGLKSKKDKKAVYLHTSSTGVLTFDEKIDVPFDDEDIARIHAIPLRAIHKEIDTWIYDNVDDITAAIIAPSTINGVGTGPFKKSSIQVINLIKVAAARKQVGYYPDRKGVLWGNVNINDLADLFVLVLDGLLAGTIEHNKEGGWYFATHHEHNWDNIYEALVPVLSKLGLIESKEITKLEKKDIDEWLGGDWAVYSYARDSRAVANRSKKIGWNPTHPDVFETLEEETKHLIETGEISKRA